MGVGESCAEVCTGVGVCMLKLLEDNTIECLHPEGGLHGMFLIFRPMQLIVTLFDS